MWATMCWTTCWQNCRRLWKTDQRSLTDNQSPIIQHSHHMTGILITDEYLSKVEQQFAAWSEFLNSVVGLLAFTLALASLGTKFPAISGLLSFIVVVLVRGKGSHIFPPEIERLRIDAKHDPKAALVLEGLSRKHLRVTVMVLKYPLFVIGTVLLLTVVFSPFLVKAIPYLAVFYGM